MTFRTPLEREVGRLRSRLQIETEARRDLAERVEDMERALAMADRVAGRYVERRDA